jgi:hypothetical protein
MASLEYLTQNSLTAYPFKRSRPVGELNNQIKDDWFYDIILVSFSPALRAAYIKSIEKTLEGNLIIIFGNAETLEDVGEPISIQSSYVENHLQNKFNSFIGFSSELFAVKFVLGPGLVASAPFQQQYSLIDSELASSAIIPCSPKLLNLTFKAYNSEISPEGEFSTSIVPVKSFSSETAQPLIKLRHNLDFYLDNTSQAQLAVEAGAGAGLYDDCPKVSEIDDVYSLNSITPDTSGKIFINPAACHALNTLSENDKTYLVSSHQLDGYDDAIIIPNHSLTLQNFCKPKCPRENIAAFAHYLNRVADGVAELNEIAFNSLETRGKGTAEEDLFNVTEFCTESTPSNPDPFLRCAEHTSPVDTYIACGETFRKYYHEFRTLQIYYDNLTVRNYTILEVLDSNSVRLNTAPTAGQNLWFRVKDNGVISNMNCASLAYNQQAETLNSPYFKVSYTTGEAYDSDNQYITLLAVNIALFNPSPELGVPLSVVLTPTGLSQRGIFKIRKAEAIENTTIPEITLDCKEYAFMEAVYSIPCGSSGGQLTVEVFNNTGETSEKIGDTYYITGIDGALCPGDSVSQSKSFRIAKSYWTDFNTPQNKNFINVGQGVTSTVMRGDIPTGGWLAYSLNSQAGAVYVTASKPPTEIISKRYSVIFKSLINNSSTNYAKCIIDYVAPPIITFPLASTYTEQEPLAIKKNITYTEESPVLKISANNMMIFSEDFPSDETDFYFSAEGLPEGLSINPSTGALLGTLDNDLPEGQPIEVVVTANNASGGASNPQTIYLSIATQAAPQLSFSDETPGPIFNISNLTTYSTENSVYLLNATNLPISFYTLYPAEGTSGLPQGLNFDAATGKIVGKVSASVNSTTSFEITATNIYGESNRLPFSLNYTAYSAPVITAPPENQIIVITAANTTTLESPLFTIEATQIFGGSDNFAEGLTNTTRNKYSANSWNGSEGIPPGFQLDLYTGKFFGALSPSELPSDPLASYSLNYPINLVASNPVNSVSRSIIVRVDSVGVPLISGVSPITVEREFAYTDQNPLFTITATNNPTSFSASGLPAGLVCSPTTGKITGLVGLTSTAGSYTVELNASNINGDADTVVCTLNLFVSIVSITPAAPYNIETDATYSNIFTVATSGVKEGDAVALSLAYTPDGLSFSNGTLSGTPTTPGTYVLRILASTQNYGSAIRDVSVVITAKTYTLSGKTLNELNSPVSGATITLSASITTLSGEDGSYSFSGVASGVYNVRATKAGCVSTPTYRRITVPAPTGSSQPALDNINFTVAGPFRTLSGKVLTTGSLSPVAGLSVSDSTRTSVTNSLGEFEFQSITNQVTLTISSTAYVFTTTVIPAGSDSVGNIIIYATPAFTLSGTITSNSNLVGDITVKAINSDTLEEYTTLATKTNNTASYSLLLLAGEYDLTVENSLNNYIFAPSSVNIILNKATQQNFTANQTYSISGRIFIPAPNSGDAVIAISGAAISTSQDKQTTSNEFGNYVLTSLAAGAYTLTASKAGLSFATQSIAITDGDITNVNFNPVTYSISGAVYYGEAAISTIAIKVSRKSDSMLLRTVTSTASGYTISNLPPGEYTIAAEHPGCTFVLRGAQNNDIVIAGNNIVDKIFDIVSVAPVAPAAPTITSIAPGFNKDFTVNFTQSVITTGSPVIKYEYTIDDGQTWQDATEYVNSGSFKISSGLEYNTAYSVKIRAVNLYSFGESSNVVIATTSWVPSAPTIVSAASRTGVEGLTIDFTSPVNTYGYPVDKYEWRVKRSNLSDWGEWLPTDPVNDIISPINTTANLDKSYNYDVQIRAHNLVGYSVESNTILNLSLYSVPSTPIHTRVDPEFTHAVPEISGNGSLKIYFIVPDNGGYPITDIEYQVYPAGETSSPAVATGLTPIEGAETEYTVAGLTGGVVYQINIRAKNILGYSSWLAYTPIKASINPSIPTINNIEMLGKYALINFTELTNGGYPIKAYHFHVFKILVNPDFEGTTPTLENGGLFYQEAQELNVSYYRAEWEALGVTPSPYILNTLYNNQAFGIKIRAENDAGLFSEFSPTQNVTPASRAPTAAPQIASLAHYENNFNSLTFNISEFSLIAAGSEEVTINAKLTQVNNPEFETVTTLGVAQYDPALKKYPAIAYTVEIYSAYMPNTLYDISVQAVNAAGESVYSAAKRLLAGVPGKINEDRLGVVIFDDKVRIKIAYTEDYNDELDISPYPDAVSYLLRKIPHASGTGMNGIKIFSLYDGGYVDAAINLYYETAINEEWVAPEIENPNWEGVLTPDPLWLGVFMGYSYPDYTPIYDNTVPRTLENYGLYLDTSIRTLANGGMILESPSLENGGLYHIYPEKYMYIDFFRIGDTYDISIKSSGGYGDSLDENLIPVSSAPLGAITMPAEKFVGYKEIYFATPVLLSPKSFYTFGFRFEYSLNGINYMTVKYFDASQVKIALNEGTYSQIFLRTANWAGEGPAISFNNIVIGAPDKPEVTTSRPSNLKIKYTIAPPQENGGSPVTSYTYKITGGSYGTTGVEISIPVAQTAIEITAADITTTYTLHIRAHNSRGYGDFNVVPFNAGTAPGAVTDVQISQGDRQLIISWKSGALNNGGSGNFIFNGVALTSQEFTYTAANQQFSRALPGLVGTSISYNIIQFNAFGQSGAVSGTSSIVHSLAPPIVNTHRLRSEEETDEYGSFTVKTKAYITLSAPQGVYSWTAPLDTTSIEYSMVRISSDNLDDVPDPDTVAGTFAAPLSYLQFSDNQLADEIPVLFEDISSYTSAKVMFRAVFADGNKTNYSQVYTINVPTGVTVSPYPDPDITFQPHLNALVIKIKSSQGTYNSGAYFNYDFRVNSQSVLTGSNIAMFKGQGTITVCHPSKIDLSSSKNCDLILEIFDPVVGFISSSPSYTYTPTLRINTNRSLPVVFNNITSSNPYPLAGAVVVDGASISLTRPTCQAVGTPTMSISDGVTPYSIEISTYLGSTFYRTKNAAYVTGKTYELALLYKAGSLSFSDFSNPKIVTFRGAPLAPTNLAATYINPTTLGLSFTPPQTRGLAIVGYKYKLAYGTYSGNFQNLTVTYDYNNKASAQISGYFDLGTQYTITVYGYSSNDGGTLAGVSSVVKITPSQVPSKPYVSTSMFNTSDKRITSSTPITFNNKGSIITKCRYTLNDGLSFTILNVAPPAGNVEGFDVFQQISLDITSWQGASLVNGNNYVFKIAAENSQGVGPYSDAITLTPATTPSAPTNLSDIYGDKNIVITFTPPNNGGSAITNYEYSTDNGLTFKALSPASATPTVPGVSGAALKITTLSSSSAQLVNGMMYICRIRAVNIKGAGTVSSSIASIPMQT